MASFVDGNRRKATANTVTAMRKNARDRQCPKCGRKGALKGFVEDWGDQVASITYCRWKDHDPPICDYVRVNVTTLTSTDPA